MRTSVKIWIGTLLTSLFIYAVMAYWRTMSINNTVEETLRDFVNGFQASESSNTNRDVVQQRSSNEDDRWEEEQRLRRAQVRRACQSFEEEEDEASPSDQKTGSGLGKDEQLINLAQKVSNLQFLYVNEEHKFIFCVVPKLGSTVWKKMLMVLNDPKYKTIDDISSHAAHYSNNLTRIYSYTVEERVFRLKAYRKFFPVRDPIERLLSAFVSKFTDEAKPGISKMYNNRYGHEWISELRNKTNANEPVKFEEMLEILSRRGLDTKTFNRHWTPINDICHPCLIEYDYLVNFTSIEQDANEILKRLLKGSSKEGFTFPAMKKNSTTGDRLRSILQNLDPELVKDVQKTYYKDYIMFGYPML